MASDEQVSKASLGFDDTVEKDQFSMVKNRYHGIVLIYLNTYVCVVLNFQLLI